MDKHSGSSLDPHAVEQLLAGSRGFYRVLTLAESASTNDDIKAAATAGEAEGLVVIADRQTRGRGRMRRPFFSPDGTGLYMSILLRPGVPAADSVLITAAAAVSVAKAIERISGRKAGIKWVNDIFIDGLKVCGILTEGAVGQDGLLQYAALGIGVNIAPPPGGFPDEISKIAGAVYEKDAPQDARARLAAAILDNLYDDRSMAEKAFLTEYRQRSMIIGRNVTVSLGEDLFTARAISIDDDCRLIVETERGLLPLCAGEVSIRAV